MRATVLAVGGFAALFSAGCVQSALNPTDAVVVTGSALNLDKTPLADTELTLGRSEGSDCLLTPSFSKPKTDAQGAFSQNLTGADTQKNDVARCFRLSLPQGPNGSYVETDFLMQVTNVKVPALQRWPGALAATQTATGVELSYTDLSASHGLAGLDYSTQVRADGHELWVSTQAASPIVYSDEVLEDFAEPLVGVRTSLPSKGSGTTFTLRYVSDELTLPSRNKVPGSRGATCAYLGAPTVCALTDGKLTNVAIDPNTVDLKLTLTGNAATQPLKKVVVRNMTVTGLVAISLEGSNDGTTWTQVVDLTDAKSYQEVAVPAGAVAYSQYRIPGPHSTGAKFPILSMGELSLF